MASILHRHAAGVLDLTQADRAAGWTRDASYALAEHRLNVVLPDDEIQFLQGVEALLRAVADSGERPLMELVISLADRYLDPEPVDAYSSRDVVYLNGRVRQALSGMADEQAAFNELVRRATAGRYSFV